MCSQAPSTDKSKTPTLEATTGSTFGLGWFQADAVDISTPTLVLPPAQQTALTPSPQALHLQIPPMPHATCVQHDATKVHCGKLHLLPIIGLGYFKLTPLCSDLLSSTFLLVTQYSHSIKVYKGLKSLCNPRAHFHNIYPSLWSWSVARKATLSYLIPKHFTASIRNTHHDMANNWTACGQVQHTLPPQKGWSSSHKPQLAK